MIAYLVVREAGKLGNVFRLTPGQTMTVGRAPTNRIVLNDEVCSRHHCEVFQDGETWRVRDLQSRNGTLLDNSPVIGDQVLEANNVIQIGNCGLTFTYDLAAAFQDHDRDGQIEGDTGTAWTSSPAAVRPPAEPTIIHRKGENRFARAKPEAVGRDRTSRELAQLYKLALEMGSATTPRQLAEYVLNGLASGTSADLGAVLLLPKPALPDTPPGKLEIVAYKSSGDKPYQQVSEYLSGIVLKGREAVLARDVADDSRLLSRDSLGDLQAKSVICAPIRRENAILGLIHLYTTDPGKTLEPDDLEFTLAVADQCALALESLRRQQSLADGLAQARTEAIGLREQLGIESELIGNSESLRQLRVKISRIAPTDATVLIRGESGVGKELVARAIHYSSRRKNGPFVCMNCAALSESLLESELFGHEKGSFTGAVARKSGKFEQAHKGTLMLDEVGEMSLAIQAKFLRVLEGHPFERVGGGTPVQVDVRVVAATNRDLERAVEENSFRKDLYFRLQVVELAIDPLRIRAEDIPELAEFFREKFARKTGRAVKGYSVPAMEKLCGYSWPGNVRELQNTIERAVILCQSDQIEPSDIQLSLLGLPDQPRAVPGLDQPQFGLMNLDDLEQRHILSVLDHTQWNKTQAAQILGIERSTLDRKLKRYQVSRPDLPGG